MADPLKKVGHHLLGILIQPDIAGRTSAHLRHAVHQKPIRRRSHAKAENPRRPKIIVQLAQSLILIADKPIGEKRHDPQPLRIGRKNQAGSQPIDQHGPAAAVHAGDVLEGHLDVVRTRRNRSLRELRRPIAEVDDLKTVRAVHVCQRVIHRRLRLLDRAAVHAAGGVEREHHLQRLARRI